MTRAHLEAGGLSPGASPPIHTVGSAPSFPQKYRTTHSPSTLLTLSRIDGNGVTTITKPGTDTDNNYLNRNKNTMPHSNKGKNDAPIGSPAIISTANTTSAAAMVVTAPPATISTPVSTLSSIAEKLRRGTKKVLLFKNAPATVPVNVTQPPNEQHDVRKLEKGNSVDSAHTNTISNSSLQEVDDDEFESAELAKYMGQVNSEIR